MIGMEPQSREDVQTAHRRPTSEACCRYQMPYIAEILDHRFWLISLLASIIPFLRADTIHLTKRFITMPKFLTAGDTGIVPYPTNAKPHNQAATITVFVSDKKGE